MDGAYVGRHERRRSRSASASDEDEKEGIASVPQAQRALYRLMEDYPAPLTLRQRQLFSRHVAFHTRRYQAVLRASQTVRVGWESLHRVMSDLRAEKAALEQSLREGGDGAVAVTTAPPPSATADVSGTASVDPVGTTKTMAAEAPSASAPARPRRILLGARGGRGGGVFAHLQSVLQTAQKEEVQKYGDVRQARERIAKETRLQRVQEDLALHDQYFAPLEERRLKCDVLETACRENELVPLLALQYALYEQESRYASAFSLRASGPVATGSMFGPDDDTADVDERGAASAAPAAVCDIYCAPAAYTEEILDVIRSQVEEVLDDYLTFRARIDPVLSRLEQDQATREAQRVGQLMHVMGLDETEGGAGVLNATDGRGHGILAGDGRTGVGVLSGQCASASSVLGVSPLAGTSHAKPVRAGLGISDDDEADVDDPADLMDVETGLDDGTGASGVLSGVDAKKKERAQIQSALSVLDDFESMF